MVTSDKRPLDTVCNLNYKESLSRKTQILLSFFGVAISADQGYMLISGQNESLTSMITDLVASLPSNRGFASAVIILLCSEEL